MRNPHSWKTLSSEYVYKSKWLRVRRDKVIRPDGSEGTFEVVERDNFVLVIPLYKDSFYLIEQYRYPIKHTSLEFPQGMIEEGEEAEQAAARELKEETGLIAKEIRKLGFLWLANGHHSQGYSIYLASDFRQEERMLQRSETDMVTKLIALSELKEKIKNGEVKDSPTVAAFSLYFLHEKQDLTKCT